MFDTLGEIDDVHSVSVFKESQNIFRVLMGKYTDRIPFESMNKVRNISCEHIASMYRRRIWKRRHSDASS